jgi:hypothetical protein
MTSVLDVTSASFETTMSIQGLRQHRRRRPGAALGVALAVTALMLAGCGGGDDDAASSTSSSVAVTVAPAVTTVPATVTTLPATTTTTTVVLVTDGATLIVANASGINGAAGRMTDALAIAGFTTGDPTNSSEGQLETSKVYFVADDSAAEAVANSVRIVLGGGAIQVLPMGTPAPVESGEVGDATVVVAMGNDTSDKTLEELQGASPTTTTLGG